MNRERKNTAVIGCGYWGKNIVRSFEALGALKLVCDSSIDLLERIRNIYPGVETSTDLAAIWEDEDIQAVAIATPAETHHELVMKALVEGKDVFVEKPLALDVGEGVEMVETAKRLGRILVVGHLLWYHPVVLELKKMIQNGDFGKLRYVSSHRLNFGKIRREENVLWSFAPHDISVILGLVGELPVEVQSHGGSYVTEGLPDVTSTFMEFSNGVKAHLFMSWLHPFKEQKLVVVGDRLMAVFDDMEPEKKLMVFDHEVSFENGIPVAKKGEGVSVPVEMEEPLKAECSAFLEAVETRVEPYTNGEEGLRVLRVLDACQKSLNTEYNRLNSV